VMHPTVIPGLFGPILEERLMLVTPLHSLKCGVELC
jgi:hypothetical protein